MNNCAPWPAGAWKKHLADAVTDVNELLTLLDLDGHVPIQTSTAESGFPLRVPRGFVSRMRRGDRHDPLLRQVLPVEAENQQVTGFSADPVGELANPPSGGVLHKYRGRALIMVTGACAIHCRYCFRRHFPYNDCEVSESALDAMAADPEITEAILSGGDPLLVSEPGLAGISRALTRAPSLRRLRIHTRIPVVLPQRVDGPLISWIGGLGLAVVIVIHANHARELDDDVRRALGVLTNAGVTLLNQSVLLRGVNDNAGDLAELSEVLFDAGVLPYYLHMLDRVAGAAHFEVPEVEAKSLFRELSARLPGYLVPRLVREIPGGAAKIGVDLGG